ncbi:glycosyltransferase family 4 protein [Candidatus Falkowbacteria bacterium]|nr:glycosyltransferase family 4 protein [Candidatus Falkowbacteria bacterium]
MTDRKKLNIAIVCDPIGDYKAGVLVSALRFSKLLQSRGHKVVFIGAKSPESPASGPYQGIMAYRFRSLPLPKSGGWRLAFPTIREIKDVLKREQIDVMHVFLPMSGALVSVKAARSLKVKIVAHSHSQPENLFMDAPKFAQPMLAKIWNRYLAWIYSKAEVVIYPSELARELLHHLCRKDKSSAVISNGIDTDEYRPQPFGNFLERNKLPATSSRLLFVGRLYPEKSVGTLIEAVPQIMEEQPDVHVMIIGEGHQRPKLEKLSKELGVAEKISFMGLVSEEDKLAAYNACDVFVLPSLAELEGMVVLEAMACAKPILISDAKMSASRFFVDGNGLLFVTGDPQDLARQALKLLADKDLRKAMGERSLAMSREYDIRESVNKMEQTYYSALGL